MSQLHARYRKHELDQAAAQQIAKVCRESVNDLVFERPSVATAAGDTMKLRGIPAIGRGVSGASPGTQPDRIAV